MPSPDLTFLGHSTVRVELAGRVVLTDPLLTAGVGPLRRMSALPRPADWAGVDLVLLSHLHGDHLHLPSLRRLGTGTPIVVPRGGGAWLRGKGFRRVVELAPGESLAEGELTVTGVPAHHSGHRWGPRLTHGPDAQAMGHLLSGHGQTVYVAGDTDVFPEMTGLGGLGGRDGSVDGGIDVALLPVWGWGTSLGPGHMDPAAAALACALLKPRVAVPVHWGTLAAVGTTTLPRVGPVMRRLLVDPPHEFAAAVTAAQLPTTVLVTPPGRRVELPARSPG